MKKKVKDLKYGDTFEHEGIIYDVTGELEGGDFLFSPRINKPPVFKSNDAVVEVWEKTETGLKIGDKIRLVSSEGHANFTKVFSDNKEVRNISKIDIKVRPGESIKADLEVTCFPFDVEADVSSFVCVDPKISSIKSIIDSLPELLSIKDEDIGKCISSIKFIRDIIYKSIGKEK
jgi:hypothetical protein